MRKEKDEPFPFGVSIALDTFRYHQDRRKVVTARLVNHICSTESCRTEIPASAHLPSPKYPYRSWETRVRDDDDRRPTR